MPRAPMLKQAKLTVSFEKRSPTSFSWEPLRARFTGETRQGCAPADMASITSVRVLVRTCRNLRIGDRLLAIAESCPNLAQRASNAHRRGCLPNEESPAPAGLPAILTATALTRGFPGTNPA